jgi:Cdc6-like AAA superfamily ATPase
MEYSWILPVAEQLYANREDIQNNFQKVSNWLLGEKSTIVITGLPGVGKTVLSDYLTDVAYKRGYTSPLKSEDLEIRKTSIQKQRLDFKVIPGQDSHLVLKFIHLNGEKSKEITTLLNLVKS